jgi:hypothetical protein
MILPVKRLMADSFHQRAGRNCTRYATQATGIDLLFAPNPILFSL